jgi:sedoheptulose-bisphosphatase
MFSPGNLRAVKDNENYAKVVQSWIDKEYTLRYTGGLVPDVAQIFVKGHGVFANIDSPKHKAKLRVLYEAAAVGFLIEKAEGATLTKGQVSLMEYVNKSFDERM